MDSDLQAMVDAGKLDATAAAALDKLKPDTFCLHKSWGFGKVNSWSLFLNQIVVDFHSKKNHSMQLRYAAETLQPLADQHIFVRRVNEPDALRTLAEKEIPRLIELVLESFEAKMAEGKIVDHDLYGRLCGRLARLVELVGVTPLTRPFDPVRELARSFEGQARAIDDDEPNSSN